jgi:membrane-associated phospholipid phosphatase
MRKNLALFISLIGHPLLTLPLFITIAIYSHDNFQNPLLASLLLIFCFFVPLAIWIFVKTKNGTYTNFDVSDRRQRKSLFWFAVPLLSIITIVLFATEQMEGLRQGVLFSLILTITSQIVNQFIKCSLHVSLNIFLACLILPVRPVTGAIVLLFTILLGWSRIHLRRHSLSEVIVGTMIGLTVGSVMMRFMS